MTPQRTPLTAVQHIAVVTARILLHNPDSTFPNDAARELCVVDAQQAAEVIKLWIRQIHVDDASESKARLSGNTATSPGGSMRNRNGVGGPYFLYPWLWVADSLRLASRSLRALCREEEAIGCEQDMRAIVQGLKTQNVNWFARFVDRRKTHPFGGADHL